MMFIRLSGGCYDVHSEMGFFMITRFIHESNNGVRYAVNKGFIAITFGVNPWNGNYLQLDEGYYNHGYVITNWEIL